jgi:hypothetical protein
MTNISNHNGILAISLDFELFWGVRKDRTLMGYGHNILGVRRAIPQILNLFHHYGIHATWATVGFLFCSTKNELLARQPWKLPSYEDRRLSPYDYFDRIGISEQVDPYHYAPTLIRQIQAYPDQEIGSHTFSHYYCEAGGQTTTEFALDLRAALDLGRDYGIEINSLVLPGRQCDRAYLEICRQQGILAYRFTLGDTLSHRHRHCQRFWDWSDRYLHLSGRNSYSLPPAHPKEGMLFLPSSRYLSPYNPKFDWLEKSRLSRIIRDLNHVAKCGGIYHLCWHPHDFGTHIERNLHFLKSILQCYEQLARDYGLKSMNMGEIARWAAIDRSPLNVPIVIKEK